MAVICRVLEFSERTYHAAKSRPPSPRELSDAIHVVERYTPGDANTILYQATIEDPKVFTRPWKIAFPLGRNPDRKYEQMEYACVEGERDLEHYVEK